MLPMLRFLHILVRPAPVGSADVLDPAITSWRVWPNDIDIFGHMNNGRYQAVMDLARIDFLRRNRLFAGVLRRRWAVPVGGVHLTYTSALGPFERYELHTRLAWWDARWFYFQHDFCRRGQLQKPVCTGFVKTLFKGREGSIPTAVVIRELAGRELAIPPLSPQLWAAMQPAEPPVPASAASPVPVAPAA